MWVAANVWCANLLALCCQVPCLLFNLCGTDYEGRGAVKGALEMVLTLRTQNIIWWRQKRFWVSRCALVSSAWMRSWFFYSVGTKVLAWSGKSAGIDSYLLFCPFVGAAWVELRSCFLAKKISWDPPPTLTPTILSKISLYFDWALCFETTLKSEERL